MGIRQRFVQAVTRRKPQEAQTPIPTTSGVATPHTQHSFAAIAGISDIVKDTNKLRTTANYDNDFDIFDAMVELDPELNGAVRSVSLTGNNYLIDYKKAKNNQIRS